MLTTKRTMVLLAWAQAILEDELDPEVDTYLSWMCVRHNRLLEFLTKDIETDKTLLLSVDRLKAWYAANKQS
jgi:hypothetical protein